MGLITENVELKVNNRTYKYYEKLGYQIPRHYNSKKKKWLISTGEIITVSVLDLPLNSGIKVECRCDDCNKKMIITYGTYNTHDKSKDFLCKGCYHKRYLSGENHPNWNPILTDVEREKGRNYPEYKAFIKRVLARDNYTCFCCGNSDHNNICVHHLNSYDFDIDGRLDDNNALCLCNNCHSNFHSKYGFGHNTCEQFEEWINKSVLLLPQLDCILPSAKNVVCLDDGRIYDSAIYAARHYKVSFKQIYCCCNHEDKYLSAKGKHFLWLDEYQTLSPEEIASYIDSLKPKQWKKVVCINTNMIFDNATDAARYYDMKRGNNRILLVCHGRQQYAGKDPITHEKLKWKFYDNNTD